MCGVFRILSLCVSNRISLSVSVHCQSGARARTADGDCLSATGIDSVKQLILPNVAAALRRHAGCAVARAPRVRRAQQSQYRIRNRKSSINVTQHHTQLTEQIVATHLDTDPNWICTP